VRGTETPSDSYTSCYIHDDTKVDKRKRRGWRRRRRYEVGMRRDEVEMRTRRRSKVNQAMQVNTHK
jgi:hypothetical protein